MDRDSVVRPACTTTSGAIFETSRGESCRLKIHVGTTAEAGLPAAAPVAWTGIRAALTVDPRNVFARGLELPRGLDRRDHIRR